MVGLVIVTHSATLAAGVAELARGMGGEVPIELAGGIDVPEPGLGTDAVRVAEAIERADQGDGVLVLMDLGSAVLSAEMALDMVSAERRARVLLTEAPLAEGAVAAAVTAKLGASLEEVAAEARGSLRAKIAHLGAGEEEAPVQASFDDGSATVRLEVRNLLGLHARPAARFVQTAGSFDAEVTVTNVTTGRGPASGRSLNELATLGVRQGHEVLVAARGTQADEVLAALSALAERDFDERQEPAAAAAAAAAAAGPFLSSRTSRRRLAAGAPRCARSSAWTGSSLSRRGAGNPDQSGERSRGGVGSARARPRARSEGDPGHTGVCRRPGERVRRGNLRRSSPLPR
jgi:phosphocarrier protein FPr